MTGLFRRAEHLLLHPDELFATLTAALSKAYAKRSILIKVFEDFLLLFRLVKAWVSGEYRQASRGTVVWAVLAILYFLSPLDIIPDIFPGGYLDDIAFISYVLRKIKEDVDQFRAWEKAKA
jgi:uncharacterized membrane protein YkvA (DUF1232 family)